MTATFSEPMTASTINTTTVVLLDPSSNPVPASIAYNATTSTATLTPTLELSAFTTYSATIRGGSTGVMDFNGNALVSDYTWSFTTGAAPANTGPGGPILVISSLLNPFSRYYGEILNAEGLNEYAVADISNTTSASLANYDVAILGDIPLTSAQATMLSNWVTGGGNLIAMHPDKQLAGLLGLTPTSSTLADAYLAVQNSSGAGVGIVGQTIQFHGSADLYTLNGSSSLAALYSTASAGTSFPAVTLVNAGAGQAAAFTYDLARSVVYTRQGNPAWSGQKRDGQIPPIRSDDLYFGAASFDPEPDWVDLNKVSIPQADEQQRLLANLILQMNADRKPMPRFWYFPSGFKAVVIMTGDDHGSGGTAGRFGTYVADSPSGCSVADWQCVRATSYIYPTNPITPTQAASYVGQGFEVALPVSTDCADWTPASLESFYSTQLADFAGEFPNVPAPRTNRAHCIAWSDYDTQPQVELNHGIRLDTNYYYWPPTWVNDRPGFFTGSGIPMRFTDRYGNLIDEYQATTQMTDESGQSYPFTIDTLLDNAVGAQGFYGAFTANMHNDSVQSDGADAIIASAQARGVPVVSALQMLTWLDGRNSSSFGSLSWSNNTLNFNILAGVGARNLQAMLPTSSTSGTLSAIARNGAPVSFSTQTIKGIQYALFSAVPGSYQATYGTGGTTVTVASVTLNPTTVQGGRSSAGTVTLSGPAPTGGAVITLSSSNTAVAQVSATLPVAANATSATFNVTTGSVSADTTVSISATYGTTKAASLVVTAAPPALASLTLNPAGVIGGNSSTATVILSAVAPVGGATVSLNSGSSVAQVPANVTVAAGTTTAAFTVATSAVATTTTANISGTYGTIQSAGLTVNPPSLTSVTLNPATVQGGSPSTGTVTLNGIAPAAGVVVTLSSNSTSAHVPGSITITAGATTATFAVTTSVVSTSTSATITGTYGGTKSAVLTINPAPPALASLTMSPTSVIGGTRSTGTVMLTAPALSGGAVVLLSSSNTGAAQAPTSVTVAAGGTTATFTVTTFAIASSTLVTVSGTYGGTQQAATLTVNPPTLSSLALSPTSLFGGSATKGTVTLSGPAPSGGAVIPLTSSNTSVAQVPTSVTVSAGATTATFSVTTTPVTVNASAVISGTYGVTRSATLTVNVATLSSLTRNPTSIVGGNNSTGTVTLNGAAPAGGALVTLQSSNASAAQVPATVTIAAGSTSANFTISTSGVASSTSVTISATYGATRTTTLTVSVASLTSLTLNPTTVTGGTPSTGTLMLNGSAPPSGAVVALSSTNTSAAQVPSTATIAAGAKSVTFTVTTGAVHGASSTIRGTYRSTTRSATLTVQ